MTNLTRPYLRTEARTGRMIFDMILAAVVLGVVSAVTYGWRPLYILFISLLTAMI